MRRRRLLIILALLTIAGIAWMTSYDLTGQCAKLAVVLLTACFYWNAVVTVGRVVPAALALLVFFGGIKKRGKV